MSFVNLKIAINPWDDERYAITFVRTQADSDVDVRAQTYIPRDDLEEDKFLAVGLNNEDYGMLLGKCLLGDSKAGRLFSEALGAARNLPGKPNGKLRVQLILNPQMRELHGLRWETLRDPLDGVPLFLHPDVLFSRYLACEDARPVRARSRDDIRVLVGVAAPDDLETFKLARIEVPVELDRITEALKAIDDHPRILNSFTRVSLRAIDAALREGDGYDILFLVCHGAVVEGEPRLWLEKPDPETPDPGRPGVRSSIVSGVTLAERLAALPNRPRLVVLMSCESAGREGVDAGALAAVGPRLAQAGIPAVVAMQGQVSMETAGRFMPAFFRSLQRDNQIDLAVAEGRAAVRDEPDAWMPVLFMRLNTGRLWAQAGLHGDGGVRFSAWDSLRKTIARNQCIPIVGPEVTEDLFGSQQQIARRWADEYRYPVADNRREDLPQVAQYLADIMSPEDARNSFEDYLRRELHERFGKAVPGLAPGGSLVELLAAVGDWKRARDAEGKQPDLHKILAEMACPIYLTANPDGLLAEALRRREGVTRVVELAFDRTLKNAGDDPLFEEYEPQPEEPLVYHLFGRYSTKKVNRKAPVLSQDDYFQYLTAMGRIGQKAVPTVVREALGTSALLFIGFHLHDWKFRVLYQSLKGQEWTNFNDHSTVAVQVDPEEGQFQDPEVARKYLQKIVKINQHNLFIYWGSTASFLQALRAEMTPPKPPNPPTPPAAPTPPTPPPVPSHA